jgi:hypothetical protein
LPFARIIGRDLDPHGALEPGHRHWTTASRLCIIWLAVVITLALAE